MRPELAVPLAVGGNTASDHPGCATRLGAAADKGTGKSEKITITNEKGRLSKDDIERMVKEADEFKDADDLLKKNVETRNELERYTYNVRGSLDSEELKEKFSEEERTQLTDAVESSIKWLEENPKAQASECEERQKELEGVVNPIMVRIYSESPEDSSGAEPGTDSKFSEV